MNKQTKQYTVLNTELLKQQILHWCNSFNICCFFNSNNYCNKYSSYECLAAISIKTTIENNTEEELDKLLKIKTNNWWFGHIAYNYNKQFCNLNSNKTNHLHFPEVFLFKADTVVYIKNNILYIESIENIDEIYQSIVCFKPLSSAYKLNNFKFKEQFNKDEYVNKINELKNQIQIGNCYEINFCNEYFANDAVINPLETYWQLNKISPTPFSAFYKLNDKFLMCASPERFIKKVGNKLISEPIKGTAKRNLLNNNEDKAQIDFLKNNQKEKSENIMIVDLVRNDLSKICEAGTVKVEDFLKINSFKQVHQMISTVVGNLKKDISFYEILKAMFPMGSMTGAPKIKVMQLIDEHEINNRNIYSGSIGYIAPNNDFDFNVVIRSLAYNSNSKYLSYQVGSAITHYANAEKEYEECILKASAINSLFS